MNRAPLRAVADASVAVKMFVPEALSAQAHAVFARFASEDGADLIVPDFFFVECANVFWKWVQRSAYPSAKARAHLRDLTGLDLTVIPVQILADDALAIAVTYGITAYDACYIAAAAQLKLPLITADERLATKVAKRSCDVRWLGHVKLAGASEEMTTGCRSFGRRRAWSPSTAWRRCPWNGGEGTPMADGRIRAGA